MPAALRAVATGTLNATGSGNITKPAGTAADDILIAFHSTDEGTLANMGTPTGGATWQSLATRGSGGSFDLRSKVWWKVAGGSEPADYTFTQNSAGRGCVAIAAIVGADITTPVVAQTGNDAFSATAPTPGITPAGSSDLELRWAAAYPDFEAGTWTPPPGYSEESDQQAGGNTMASLAVKALTSNVATGTVNFTASLTVGYRHGITVAVASLPAPAGRRPVLSTAAVHRAASW
ncbi:hypothetical protein OG884_18880 [Streptosporangium sp. NBC_01755]|uniref:hypothetical protein n=1 Tax=Streptosporangium sp. NBC_01755 TaxID=2975949 RepID=UPI002DDAFAB8|nr:hypothetical protein [Streptosporangium sp. NBC_01755]WSD03874.1 hypothetical protein OG884_18880 [Streptosporangium sp. NBC_01755]